MGGRAAIGMVQLAARAAGLGQRTDPQLLADFLDQRDSSAFEALVRRHGPLVLSACRQVLRDEAAAEDAFQATFVLFYQKAANIRRRPSVGGWLFQVARRTALRARRAADRRTRHEARIIAKPPAGSELSLREGIAILHEELDRLPETYRNALILCYLEGLPRDEAAQRLGWTLNELRGRLERGRVRLRACLEKRGVTLSTGLLAAIGVTAVPSALVASAVAGSTRPSARVAALVTTSWSGLKVASALAIAAGLVFGFGITGGDPQAGAHPRTEVPGKVADKDAKPDGDRAGRVLDPDGKPISGAKVWIVEPWTRAREITRTDDYGAFRLPASEKDSAALTEYEGIIQIVATHEKFGFAFPVSKPDQDLVLRMTRDDVPIRGRILDLQGKPVAGATVTPQRVQAALNGKLDGWLAKLKAAEEQVNLITDGELRRKVAPAPFLAPVTTDAEGRFTLTGVGRERMVELRVEGPNIAASEIRVMTRAAPEIRVEYDPGNPKLGYKVYHGSTFEFAANPMQPFTGVVTDRATGTPIPGAVIRSDFPFRLEVTADSEGRYTLRGLGPGEQRLVAVPPADVSNMPLTMTGGRTNNEQPVTLNFALNRGAWVEGTVTNLRTKEPVAGAVLYYCPLGEGDIARVGGDDLAFDQEAGRTDAQGRFRIRAVPGTGAIGLNAPGGPYISASRRPLQGDSLLWSHEGIRARWVRLYFTELDAIAVVQFDPKKPRRYHLTVDRGESVKGRVLDPDGKPLAGARAARLTEFNYWTTKPLGVEFEAGQVQSSKPRFVLFWHEERKLGAVWRAKPGNPDTYDVRLKPNGSARGRLVDKDGRPRADHPIEVYFRTPGDAGWGPWFPTRQVRTDATGQFELANVPEGVDFSLRYSVKDAPAPGRFVQEFRVKSGETKDLGNMKSN